MIDNAQELSRRFHREARALRIATQADLSGFPVTENKCHQNVAAWVAVHPDHTHVRGWLITESGGVPGFVFDKHSVVGVGDELLDITPRRDQSHRRFLPYEGTLDEFDNGPQQLMHVATSRSEV